jgi:hypothetical protein
MFKKTIFMLLLTAALVIVLNAQEYGYQSYTPANDGKQFLFGMAFAYGYSSFETDYGVDKNTQTTNSFGFTPMLGVSFDRFSGGAYLIWSSSTSEYERIYSGYYGSEKSKSESTAKSLGFGLMGRVVLQQIYDLSILGRIDFQHYGTEFERDSGYVYGGGKYKYETTTNMWQISPEIDYKVTDNISLYTNIGGIQFGTEKDDEFKDETSIFRVSLFSEVTLGLIYYF